MSYFSEVDDYRTYTGKEDDFHFIYNANTGGGQSFLGGKFRDKNGALAAPTSLNGRIAVFRFLVETSDDQHDVLLTDDSTTYEIKPRADGDSNMKLSVGGKPTPSSAIAAFLMLPEPCGVKRSADVNTSVLNGNNYWLQSMWLGVDTAMEGKAIFTPKDCIICGGVDKQGQGSARCFAVDFKQRISDIIQLARNSSLEGDVLSCVRHFADIYRGNKPFVYEESTTAIKAVMKYLSTKYPEQYSGTLDPLSFIQELSHSSTPPVKQLGPRQKIVYGAPGTGKSFRIKGETAKAKVFRTTFHPDSDYASFVGAYKPIMKSVERTALVGKKLEMADVESVKEELKKEKVISYEFVDQVFTKAYIQAWAYQKMAKDGETPKRVYLVIEEINRGNCAQVFGDLFQLLDRNASGFSDYAIKPDSDFGRHIGELLGKAEGTFGEVRKTSINALYPDAEEGVNVVDEVMAGRLMLLPDNLLIRATMNTSDQSLFPMDSAFKRRWDWKYVAIKDHPEEEWEIEIDAASHYRWWDFLVAINKEIFKATSSEDKQLGYFFVRARGKKIDLDMFVNKVVFYLWNSVFRDCYTDCEFMKQGVDDYFTFTSFFKDGNLDSERAKAFLGKLKLEVKSLPTNNAEVPDMSSEEVENQETTEANV